ncbi:MAG: RsmB/NOP family class I SAM-dependent RNA methyltransferase [Octadecabacter sp.]|nr:RsmB/NOP family class I SAM-dependent RNA methyltransferase [Octadecabacter sp.]
MTPAARVSAAIEVLDAIFAGDPVEKALTGWGRAHRFAGSKDRAAIRDHVFQALRCRASYGWLGGAETGRGVMLGAARAAGQQDALFSGEGHGPLAAADDEIGQELATAPRPVRLDMPDWLLPHFDTSCGAKADAVLAALQTRAPVFLRVNVAKGDMATAAASLDAEGITTRAVERVKGALQVIENERRIGQSQAYLTGLVELQDASSQAAMGRLGDIAGLRILDYCAGGGGKALALAAQGAEVTAHDIDPRRMKDIAPRAARAGVSIACVDTTDLPKLPAFDVVLCDAPCSGSGTWRRTPAAKWALTPQRLQELTQMQDTVLRDAAPLVAVGGRLAYATCSVFDIENKARVQAFTAHSSQFALCDEMLLLPADTGDGFYFSVLSRSL